MYSWPAVDVPQIPPSPDLSEHLHLWDTAAQKLVPAGPTEGEAKMYVCGITPYDATHLGHANTYLAFDMLNRVWRDAGLKVTYTQNITDVDDPLLERAQDTGQEWEELASEQIELFRTDMAALRVIPPDHYIGAVESIASVIELIQRLEPTGLVYQVDDAEHPDWYFNTVNAPEFGRISRLNEAEMTATFAERGGDPERPGKKHPLDCLLWRSERDGEPSWASSLGSGRPGWHIECTAIALDTLGKAFDVQGGGSDLVFPHHEMCAAEAIAASGAPLAQVYVHSGMVALDGEKMSKSKGNLELVSRLRQQGADPMAIRMALLNHHYRSDWEWTDQDLSTAEARLEGWRAAVSQGSSLPAGETIEQMRRALRNDLDTPTAMDAVDTWVAASMAIESDDTSAPAEMAQAIDALLGVQL